MRKYKPGDSSHHTYNKIYFCIFINCGFRMKHLGILSHRFYTLLDIKKYENRHINNILTNTLIYDENIYDQDRWIYGMEIKLNLE